MACTVLFETTDAAANSRLVRCVAGCLSSIFSGVHGMHGHRRVSLASVFSIQARGRAGYRGVIFLYSRSRVRARYFICAISTHRSGKSFMHTPRYTNVFDIWPATLTSNLTSTYFSGRMHNMTSFFASGKKVTELSFFVDFFSFKIKGANH